MDINTILIMYSLVFTILFVVIVIMFARDVLGALREDVRKVERLIERQEEFFTDWIQRVENRIATIKGKPQDD